MKALTPELLAPAGNLQKLKIAVLYGANAVYLGGLKFGLRSAADNFTESEIEEGVNFAHLRGAKVYVVLNSFLHDQEVAELPPFIHFLEKVGVDAVIVSDLGVVHEVRRLSQLEIHLSTQSSCLNSYAAKFWKQQGVTRIVLGREVSIAEAKRIKEQAGIEVEMFIHGAMCMAISGKCSLSNYSTGRDSNRGGCAQNCRFHYTLTDGQKSVDSFFMSSKDLNGMELLPQFIEAGIDSLKIEGRMKSHLYVGTLSLAYSQAIASYRQTGNIPQSLYQELDKVTHRAYCSGSLDKPAGGDSIYAEREHEEGEYQSVGSIIDVYGNEFLMIEVRAAFHLGDTLEILTYQQGVKYLPLSFVKNVLDEDVARTNPGTIVKIPFVEGVAVGNIVRLREGQ